jgi:hypothetical protein
MLLLQVNLIGYDFQFLDLCLMFLANLPDDFFQVGFDGLHQHLPPIFRTPNYMVVASVAYVPVALVGLDHRFQYTAECYLLTRADVLVTGTALVPLPKYEDRQLSLG